MLKELVLNPPIAPVLITDVEGLKKLQDFFDRTRAGSKILGWDIETTPTKDYFWRRIRTMQFGNATEQYVIDLLAFVDNDSDALMDCQGYYGIKLDPRLQPVIDIIKPVICGDEILKVGVYLTFEYENHYWLLGLRTQNFFSCDMVERVIYAGSHSLKDYSFYGMESMMARYFGVQIDKSLQESFNLKDPLTPEQIVYAALDTRLPLGIRNLQNVIVSGHSYEDIKKKNKGLAEQLKGIPGIVFGDDLRETALLENNAIGAFSDMHVHGDRIDREKWTERVNKCIKEFAEVLNQLDEIFIPFVGDKKNTITEQDVDNAHSTWKSTTVISEEEIAIRGKIKEYKKDLILKAQFDHELKTISEARLAERARLKIIYSEMGKKHTAQKKLLEKCEGQALINYDSGEQLMDILGTIHKDLKKLTSTEDEVLEKYEYIPVMKLLRSFRGLAKEINTYGMTWVQEWTTGPKSEEGWLHPGDGLLHCEFNQYDAETGRSSSSKPNAQNLPQGEEVRSCFIADPPNENIRISNCCESDTEFKFNNGNNAYVCQKCRSISETHAEEYVLITADMSGAELRIIADDSGDPIWIDSFNRGEDVHSVGTELLYPEEWPKGTIEGCKYFKLHESGPYVGTPMRHKCKCPVHNELRNGNKATNFLLAYGGGPATLAKRIKATLEVASMLFQKHEATFPAIWKYLADSGIKAKQLGKSFDMFGRRRLFPKPTWENAKVKAREDREEKLRFHPSVIEKNFNDFLIKFGRKPTGGIADMTGEKWILAHREPNEKEIANAYKAMFGSIERQGKNHRIQGTNASIAKIAMGSGKDKNGKPFLWYTLPAYRAKLKKFVHDELVVQSPKQHSKEVAALIGDAFKRAASEKMTKVIMEFDFNISNHWKK